MFTTTVAVSNEEFRNAGHINVDLAVTYDAADEDAKAAALRLLNDAYAEARRRIE